ncbi:MAG: hypothetical protein JW809_17570 [Pirellulales bacterium]|nr:hypothetical protein [Pirellulales bacterium]
MPVRHAIGWGVLVALGLVAGARGETTSHDPEHGPVEAAVADLPGEVLADWRAQDGVERGTSYREAIGAIVEELATGGDDLRARLVELDNVGPDDPRWERLYRDACIKRRAARLRTVQEKTPRIVFTKHYDLGGSHYAYTEGQSDAQHERTFVPGGSLCLLTMNGLFAEVRALLDDPGGVLRDPDVSYDGGRILFAWKKSLDEDDFHLYDYDVATGRVRQLTSGLGFADYEGAYAPGGQIIFSSTRCVQTVDCWWTEVSNLYTCDADGRYLRRLGFDQVHTNYPTVTPDGRVLYTRWEYSDRGQMYVQGLFEMNPDGTRQTELYGNNSWFPTSLVHARAIPGTGKVVAILTGHHTLQKGWLGLVDPSRGRQENEGVQLIAPPRQPEAVRVDFYAQSGDQFQYPYPLSETEFLVAFKPDGATGPFAIYWMDRDGRRELLASDERISCNQPVPLAPRSEPPVRASVVDYRQTQGLCYVQDVYEGPGLAGVPRGTARQLRVVAIEYRPAGVGSNENRGPGGEAMISTPIAIGNGAWDPKTVLGEATIRDDGSVYFAVPARTPVYFQVIDERGYAIQTMRSWTTLQPGETASCVGCHEDKNAAPPAMVSSSLALAAGAEQLAGFYGPARGFSFRREIQPILDRHCTRCHNVEPSAASALPLLSDTEALSDKPGDAAFSLLGAEVLDRAAKRRWNRAYLVLTASRTTTGMDQPIPYYQGDPDGPIVNWISAQSAPPMLPPYAAGAARSRLMTLVNEGHGDARLSREETDKLACWIDLLVPFCGDYVEANAWSDEDRKKYEHFLAKRKGMEEVERRNIEEWRRLPVE